jgi:hypothetical protein
MKKELLEVGLPWGANNKKAARENPRGKSLPSHKLGGASSISNSKSAGFEGHHLNATRAPSGPVL